jgi:hypothetical protein
MKRRRIRLRQTDRREMARSGEVHATTRRPETPRDADFALRIDFKRGEQNPYRIFQAADLMIRALQGLDATLVRAIDTKIEPIMVLEEIESGSLIIWLRNILTATDDEALKKLDWKPAVGKYLVRAKHAYIRWANRSEPERTLMDLGREILSIAKETDVLQMPIYGAPPIQELVEAAKEVEAAKSPLIPGEDKISYISPGETDVDFDLTVRWAPEDLISLAVKETAKFENMPMTLIVRRPDYLGSTKWDFRHGGRQISARIDDREWLSLFQSRKIDVRPGDALKCLVTAEHSYGYDNELIRDNITVTKVIEILENNYLQLGLFDGTTAPQ